MPKKNSDRSIFFALPGYLILTVFMILPVIVALVQSFIKNDMPSLQNYVQIFTNYEYKHALLNNLVWIVFAPILTWVTGTFIGVMVYRYCSSRVSDIIMFMPMSISLLSTGIIFRILFQSFPESGPVNILFQKLFHVQPHWLDKNLITVSMIIAFIWVWSGFISSLVITFLKEFNQRVIDAAFIDGANYIQTFFYVILPNMKYLIMLSLSSLTIYILKIFDFIVVIPNSSIQVDASVISYQIWYLFYGSYNKTGLASALSILLLLAVIPISLINMKLSYKRG